VAFLLALVVAVAIGFACMRSSETFKARFGATPWSIPSWVWFLLGFLLGVIGGVLYLIARMTTKSRLMRTSYFPPQSYSSPSMSQQSWGQPMGTPSPPPPTGTGAGSAQPYPPAMPPPMPPPVPPPVTPSEQPPSSGS
jgi:hypothetical protein